MSHLVVWWFKVSNNEVGLHYSRLTGFVVLVVCSVHCGMILSFELGKMLMITCTTSVGLVAGYLS